MNQEDISGTAAELSIEEGLACSHACSDADVNRTPLDNALSPTNNPSTVSISDNGVEMAELAHDVHSNNPANGNTAAITESQPSGPANSPPPIVSPVHIFRALRYQIFHNLKRRQTYIDSAKHILLILAESIVYSAILVFYVWLLSIIPFTRSNTSTHYYSDWWLATFYAWVTFTTFTLICYGFWVFLYGLRKTNTLLFFAVFVPLTVWSWVNYYAFLAWGLQPWWLGLELISYGVMAVFVLISSLLMGKLVSDRRLLRIFSIPLIVHIAIFALYSYVLLPYYRSLDSVVTRSVIRLVVHPILTEINITVNKLFTKMYQIPNKHFSAGILLGIYLESAMFGRFLINTLGNPSATAAVSVLVGLLEITMRIAEKPRSDLLYILKCKIARRKLERNINEDMRYLAVYSNFSMLVEYISIVLIPFMIYFFDDHRLVFNLAYKYGESPDLGTLVRLMIIQLVIEMAVDLLCIFAEKLQEIPTTALFWESFCEVSIWKVLNFLQMVTLILYCLRTLPTILFCDANDPCTCHRGLDRQLFKDICK